MDRSSDCPATAALWSWFKFDRNSSPAVTRAGQQGIGGSPVGKGQDMAFHGIDQRAVGGVLALEAGGLGGVFGGAFV